MSGFFDPCALCTPKAKFLAPPMASTQLPQTTQDLVVEAMQHLAWMAKVIFSRAYGWSSEFRLSVTTVGGFSLLKGRVLLCYVEAGRFFQYFLSPNFPL